MKVSSDIHIGGLSSSLIFSLIFKREYGYVNICFYNITSLRIFFFITLNAFYSAYFPFFHSFTLFFHYFCWKKYKLYMHNITRFYVVYVKRMYIIYSLSFARFTLQNADVCRSIHFVCLIMNNAGAICHDYSACECWLFYNFLSVTFYPLCYERE